MLASLHLLAALTAALGPSDAWLGSAPTELDAAFAHVTQRVRFEPYPGILRGARGTAISGAGNAWDKSLLLAELLRRGGYEVRFAEGELTAANAATLLRGAYPPTFPQANLGPEFAPYRPDLDPVVRQAIASHLWVEVNQGGTWLPLDPSFPRAKIGEAYAQRRQHFEAPPPDAFHRLGVVWKERGGSGTRELASTELLAAEVGLVPVTLSQFAVPLDGQPADTNEAGGVTGLIGGAFGGGQPEPQKKKPEPGDTTARLLKRWIQIGDRVIEAATTLLASEKDRARPDREWLELTLHVPGRGPQRFERELYRDDGAQPLPSLRRYSLGIFTGLVPLAALDEQFRAARALPLADWREEAQDLGETPADARKAAALDRRLGPLPGYLLTLSHAQASDALTERLARRAGVVVVREKPRVLIAGLTARGLDTSKPDQTLTLDLRMDEVRALPFPGHAERRAEHFQRARGWMSSTLEGEVLSQVTGEPAITTSALMAAAQREGVPLVAVATTQDASRLSGELTAEGYELLYAHVRDGKQAVAPARKLKLGDRERSGFWAVDPVTGALVGVMDDGLHQAMVQYQLELSKIGLNEDSGKVVGMMVGAIATTGLLAAKILEHGEVTAKVLKEVKASAEGVLCYSCPKAEAKVGVKAAAGEDCLKRERAVEGFAKVDFCEGYSDGFKCSMGMLLAAYEAKGKTGLEFELSFDAGAELGCKKWPAKGDK